jgi:hypothetical protein
MIEIEVLPIGSRVALGDGEVPGTISAVCVRGEGNVTYEVAWWNGRARIEQWLPASEVKARAAGPLRIGFLHPGREG